MASEEEFVDEAARGDKPEELVVLLEDDDFIGSGSLEVQDDRLELKSTMVREERRQELVEGCTGYEKLFEVRLEDVMEACVELNRDYIDSRYHDAAVGTPSENYTEKKGEKKLESAELIIEWTKKHLKN